MTIDFTRPPGFFTEKMRLLDDCKEPNPHSEVDWGCCEMSNKYGIRFCFEGGYLEFPQGDGDLWDEFYDTDEFEELSESRKERLIGEFEEINELYIEGKIKECYDALIRLQDRGYAEYSSSLSWDIILFSEVDDA
jgi:hypothetical protein